MEKDIRLGMEVKSADSGRLIGTVVAVEGDTFTVLALSGTPEKVALSAVRRLDERSVIIDL